MKRLYDCAKATVRNCAEIGDWFHQEEGSPQGRPIISFMLISCLVRAMQIKINWLEDSWTDSLQPQICG